MHGKNNRPVPPFPKSWLVANIQMENCFPEDSRPGSNHTISHSAAEVGANLTHAQHTIYQCTRPQADSHPGTPEDNQTFGRRPPCPRKMPSSAPVSAMQAPCNINAWDSHNACKRKTHTRLIREARHSERLRCITAKLYSAARQACGYERWGRTKTDD